MKERYMSKVAVFLILTREVDGKTEILLQRRFNTGYMDGKYDMACSGHLEAGESVTTATIREAKEELGIQLNEKDLEFVALIHPYQENFLNVFFKANTYIGTPTIMEPNKCDDLQWFNITSLPKNIVERYKVVIENMGKAPFYDDGDFSHMK